MLNRLSSRLSVLLHLSTDQRLLLLVVIVLVPLVCVWVCWFRYRDLPYLFIVAGGRVRVLLSVLLLLTTLLSIYSLAYVEVSPLSLLLDTALLTVVITSWDHSRLTVLGERWWRANGVGPLPEVEFRSIVDSSRSPEEVAARLQQIRDANINAQTGLLSYLNPSRLAWMMQVTWMAINTISLIIAIATNLEQVAPGLVPTLLTWWRNWRRPGNRLGGGED